ncbi:hypothetical protein ACWDOP_03135 [Nocardia sp. NPDC003693]
MELELPDPRALWVIAAVTDVFFAAFPGDVYDPDELASRIGTTSVISGGRLDHEDGAGNWFTLIRYTGDRAILFGWDRDNEVWDQPYDPRAAAPEWVRSIELKTHHPDVLTADAVSFLRWWENGRWHSTPTEHDDGLYMCLREYAQPGSLARRVEEAHTGAEDMAYDDDTDEVLDHVSRDELTSLARTAGGHAVTEHDLNILAPEIAHAAYRYFWQAGIASEAPQPVEPLPATTQ